MATLMTQGKRAIGDGGYTGEPNHIAVRNKLDTPEVMDFKKRARACHETFNERIKAFNVLDTRFRHCHTKHKLVFEAVCVLTQYDIENGHPLFDLNVVVYSIVTG
jgi:hypothetical protein